MSTREEREQRVIDAGLVAHSRRDPIVYSGVQCYLAGQYTWEELLLEMIKKQAVDRARILEQLMEFQMRTPTMFHPKSGE